MGFLRWIGGFVLLFWLIGILFSIGGAFINVLLLVAVVVFIIDALASYSKRKR